MAKRFSDSEIWKKQWYCDLSPALKVFWKYICDMCDHAGVWEPNIPLACFQIGAKITEEEILKEFNGNVVKLSNGKFFIPDFIRFQYGDLNKNHNPHKPIFASIEKNKLPFLEDLKGIDTLSIPLEGFLGTLMDKDKDKDKEKDKEKDKDKKNKKTYTNEFEAFWNHYPRKEDKGHAIKAFAGAVSQTSVDIIVAGSIKYKNHCIQANKERQYIKLPSTWLNGHCWLDEYETPPAQDPWPYRRLN